MSSSDISITLRKLIVERAKYKCEYCLIHQNFSIFTHEIDHIIASKHGGGTVKENLALSCLPCNRHKGSDLSSIDQLTGKITPLFNPRHHNWEKHFRFENGIITGLTSEGRTTVFLLQFNEASRVIVRQLLSAQGLYP